MENLTYRKLSLADKPKLLGLDEAVLKELKERERQEFIIKYFSQYSCEELKQLFNKKRYIMLGALNGNTLDGALRLTIDQDDLAQYHEILGTDTKKCLFGNLMVRPEHRRQKIMTALAGHAIGEADKQQCETAVALIHAKNGPGLGIFEKLRFEPAGKMIEVAQQPYIVVTKEL